MFMLKAATPMALWAVLFVACHPVDYSFSEIEFPPPGLDAYGCTPGEVVDAADEERPLAICQVSDDHVSPLRESVSLYGDESYDPNGGTLIDYDWSLVRRPHGSDATLDDSDSRNQHAFLPDVAGEYRARLVVTNEQCVASLPCDVTIEATPEEGLWVELSWAHAGDDLDLHLVRDDGAFQSRDDCYYGNCDYDEGLDWGVVGDTEDNPRLDLDDISGTGPENINIYEPVDGTYTVVVHDFPGSVLADPNPARIRIYLDGELALDQSRTLRREDAYVSFAEIAWPSLEIATFVQ